VTAYSRIGILFIALVGSAAPVLSAPQSDPVPIASLDASPLLRRMVNLNPTLRTYKATIHLDVALKSFVPLNPSLDGNIFFKQPDKEAVVFDTVPSLASQFKKVYPRVDVPANWLRLYDVSQLSDDGASTVFRLIPKKNGRIEHLDVKADDTNATIKEYTWTYKDGGFVTFDQTFETISGNLLPEKQTGHVELPSYKADVTSVFSNYQLNVQIADSVFEEK
jgi:hypothetical protein